MSSKFAGAAKLGAAACSLWLFLKLLKRRRRAPAFPPARPVEDVLRRGPRKAELPKVADAIIIGAGPSGLALAVMLGRRGKRVVVFEQHDRAGGGLHTFTAEGFPEYEFEVGYHYAGELSKGKELRAIIDSLTGGEVEFAELGDCPVEPGVYDKVFFQDDKYSFTVPCNRAEWLQSLQNEFPRERDGLDLYSNDLQRNGASALPFMIWRSLPSRLLKKYLTPLLAEPVARLSTKAAEGLKKITSDERLLALLGYLSLGCTGVTLSEIDYRTVMGLHGHFSEGAQFPVGGPSAIAAAMVRQIESLGGRVFVRARVSSIMWQGDGAAKGVRLVKDNIEVEAPIVVSTIGLHATTNLMGSCPSVEPLLKQMSPLSRTHGHIFGFVGINGNAEELQLPRRNLWVLPGRNIEKCMADFQKDPDCPFGYVGIAFPSTKDPSYDERHPGKSTCAMLAGDLPWEWFEAWESTRVHHRGEDYDAFKKKFELRLLNILYENYPQLRGKVDYVDIGTPLDTNFYLGKTRGESYGLRQDLAKSEADFSWLASKPVVDHWPEGFYLAGQDITSDGFAPAIVSALFAATAIEGVLHWLELPKMLGFRGTLKAIFD